MRETASLPLFLQLVAENNKSLSPAAIISNHATRHPDDTLGKVQQFGFQI
jgi:hypothetical protein